MKRSASVRPARSHVSSPRPYPARLPAFTYPAHWTIRRVSGSGGFKWHRHAVVASEVLAGEDIGLAPVTDGLWSLYLDVALLARFDERTFTITDIHATRSSPIIPVCTPYRPSPQPPAPDPPKVQILLPDLPCDHEYSPCSPRRFSRLRCRHR